MKMINILFTFKAVNNIITFHTLKSNSFNRITLAVLTRKIMYNILIISIGIIIL